MFKSFLGFISTVDELRFDQRSQANKNVQKTQAKVVITDLFASKGNLENGNLSPVVSSHRPNHYGNLHLSVGRRRLRRYQGTRNTFRNTRKREQIHLFLPLLLARADPHREHSGYDPLCLGGIWFVVDLQEHKIYSQSTPSFLPPKDRRCLNNPRFRRY